MNLSKQNKHTLFYKSIIEWSYKKLYITLRPLLGLQKSSTTEVLPACYSTSAIV